MIPWPIAVLTLFYGVIATVAAAHAWRMVVSGSLAWAVLHKASISPFVWALVWVGVASAAMVGLPLRRLWGRSLAMITSWLLILTTLALAGVLVASGKPGLGLAVTFSVACHYLMIRYLKRPMVVAWFRSREGSAV
jgi:hypothetical protein